MIVLAVIYCQPHFSCLIQRLLPNQPNPSHSIILCCCYLLHHHLYSLMEGLSTNLYKGIRGYWKRKNYQRIDGSSRRRTRNNVKLGSGNGKKRFWKIKITPKLRFLSISSTKRFFIRLRDSYVNMMLGVANSRSFNSGIACGAGGIGGSIGYKFGKDPIKEYDEKVIIEIYKARLAQGRLMAPGPNAVPVKLATVLESR